MIGTLEWLWSVRPSAVEAVAARARLLMLDTLGCAIAGVAEPEVRALAAGLGAGEVPMPGLGGLSPAAWTVVFAAGACWHEACEGLAEAHGRPGLHVIPAVLGRAVQEGRSLGELIDAVATGYEVGGRMGVAWRIKPGLHVDGAWGSFGAAAGGGAAGGVVGGAGDGGDRACGVSSAAEPVLADRGGVDGAECLCGAWRVAGRAGGGGGRGGDGGAGGGCGGGVSAGDGGGVAGGAGAGAVAAAGGVPEGVCGG